MKNIIFFLLVIAVLASPVYSQSDLPNPSGAVINFNIGNLGFGGSFPFESYRNFEGFLSLLGIGIEDRDTGFGIEFCPFMFTVWGDDNGLGDLEEVASLNLLNLSLYWNVISYFYDGGHFYMGPFASVNYMFVGDEFYWDKYVFTIGIHTGLRRNFRDVNYNAFSFEVGYRNVNGHGRYYVGGKIDIITLLLASLVSSSLSRGYHHHTW